MARPFFLAKTSLLTLSFSILVGCSATPERHNYSETAHEALTTENTALFGEPQTRTEVLLLEDIINDPFLDELTKQALQGNPSLQKTALSLEASAWNIKSLRGESLPSASASLSAQESSDSDTTYSAGLSVSWQLDLWSKLNDSRSAAEKTLASDAETFRASQATLVGNVMKNWLLLIANQRAIDIEQQRLILLETNEKLIIQRFRNGLGTLEGLDEAKTSTSQSRADLAEYQETLASNQRAMKLLLGDNKDFPMPASKDYPEVYVSLDELPAQDLSARPDIRAAYLAIEAADLEANVAFKDMLPSLSLSATLSDSGPSLRDALFVSPVWSLLGQLTAPLFQGGQLKAASEIAKLDVAQSYQDYRSTLLTAVNEVEDALGQEKVINTQRMHIRDALTSAESNLSLYEQKYRGGLVELSDLISAQQSVYDLEAQLDTLQYEQLTNRVDLGLALGLGVKNP